MGDFSICKKIKRVVPKVTYLLSHQDSATQIYTTTTSPLSLQITGSKAKNQQDTSKPSCNVLTQKMLVSMKYPSIKNDIVPSTDADQCGFLLRKIMHLPLG